MKKTPRFVSFCIAIIAGIVIGYGTSWFIWRPTDPIPTIQTATFISNCAALNGKQFDKNLLVQLNGFCLVPCKGSEPDQCGTVVSCSQESTIDDFVALQKECASYISDASLPQVTYLYGSEKELPTPSKERLEFDACYDRFRSKYNASFTAPTFSIRYQKKLDDTWSCQIQQLYPVIKAVPVYAYD